MTAVSLRRTLLTGLVFALLAAGPAAASLEIYYAPEDAPLDRIVELYERARHSIFVAVYALTAPPAVKALIAAKHRGVDVRVLSDRERLDDPKQRAALAALRLAGIPIRINRHESLMHLKQIVVDGEVNASGSMNHTTSGNRYNDERLDVIRDRAASAKAREKFLAMWNDPERYRPWEGE